MKAHVHANLIKAWADGFEIESYSAYENKWRDAKRPIWMPDVKYRIKPQPTPDVVSTYWAVPWGSPMPTGERVSNLKLIFDGETGALKAAELLT